MADTLLQQYLILKISVVKGNQTFLENNFRHHDADTVIPDVHKEIRVADNESPALLSKYQTCLFSSAIPTVSAFENSQAASFEFELSPSADLQPLSFILSPAQRPHTPANRNSHTTVSQEETPSYLFLKIYFPVFLGNTLTTAPTRGKVVDGKTSPADFQKECYG